MNRWSKRPAAVLLAAVLILGLTACGSKESGVHRIDWVTASAYLAEDIPLPVRTGDLIGCCIDGECMHILADEKTEGGEVRSTFMYVESSMVFYQLAPNEIQMERFWDLYNAPNCVESTESNVWDIIREQADIYFAGDKSLDETADLSQRRVTLYVNENR